MRFNCKRWEMRAQENIRENPDAHRDSRRAKANRNIKENDRFAKRQWRRSGQNIRGRAERKENVYWFSLQQAKRNITRCHA